MDEKPNDEVPAQLESEVDGAFTPDLLNELRSEAVRESIDRLAADDAELERLERAALQRVQPGNEDAAQSLVAELNSKSDWDLIRRCLQAAADGPNGLWDAERRAEEMRSDPREEFDRIKRSERIQPTLISPGAKRLSTDDEILTSIQEKADFVAEWATRFAGLW